MRDWEGKVPRKRNGYYYINGKEYVSVTKVLGEVLAKPALMYWYGKKAAQIALKDPGLNEKEVMAELQMQIRQSQDRGHYLHSLAESMPDVKHLVEMDRDEECCGYIEALQAYWNSYKPTIIASEIELYSDVMGTAGRCDQVIEINGVKWIVDYKTGKDVYKEVELQLAAYKDMMRERKIAEIDNTAAVLLKQDGGFEFHRTTGKIEDFRNVLEVWKWLKRKE